MAANALQAVLDKASRDAPAATQAEAVVAAPARPPRERRSAAKAAPVVEPAEGKFYRPVRDGRRFVGAHFPPEVARQLKLIAAEDDTTIQALLEEAIDLLFVKKGRAKMSSLMNS